VGVGVEWVITVCGHVDESSLVGMCRGDEVDTEKDRDGKRKEAQVGIMLVTCNSHKPVPCVLNIAPLAAVTR